MISAGIAQLSSRSRHRSSAVTSRAGPRRCARRGAAEPAACPGPAVEPDGIPNEAERRPPSWVGHRLHECSAFGRCEDLVHRPDRGAGHGSAFERLDPLGRGPGRRPRRGAGSARRDGALAPRSWRSEDRRPTPRVRRPRTFGGTSRSFPAARMNGRSEAWNAWYGQMLGCAVPIEPGDDPADQEVGRLVHHRGRARVEERHAHVSSPTGPRSLVEGGEDADRRLQVP